LKLYKFRGMGAWWRFTFESEHLYDKKS